MNLLITGGTGFVGNNLTKLLIDKGHHVYIMTRSPHSYENTSYTTFIGYDEQVEQLPVIHGVVNLAGESLFGYWSKKKKEAIRSSRVETTHQIIEMMKKMEKKPDVFISGSAVGYYGTSEEFIYTEDTTQSGSDFLAAVTTEWENTAKQAEEKLGIRTVYTRFGIILGQEGALQYMKLPVKLFAGGRIGSGEQWMSWVHIEDVVGLIHHCIINESICGPINVTAPHPKRNKDFINVLTNVLKRPYWLPAPAPLMRLTIGEMSELITKGQYVLPKKAQEHNYAFSFPYLQEALQEIERSAGKLS